MRSPTSVVVVPEFEQIPVPPQVGKDHVLLELMPSSEGTSGRGAARGCLAIGCAVLRKRVL